MTNKSVKQIEFHLDFVFLRVILCTLCLTSFTERELHPEDFVLKLTK